MAQAYELKAELRERAGKGAARAERRAGRLPGVIYGNKEDPILISVDPVDLAKEINAPGFFTHVYEVTVGSDKYRVLARDLQQHPINDLPIHVDFMRFSAKTRLAVEVVVEFINEDECPGLEEGGVLNVVRYAVELRCQPDNIPETIVADLMGLEIGDTIHISSIPLPDGVEPTVTDRDFTVATIAAPTIITDAELEEGEEGEEGAEGEGGDDEEAADGDDDGEKGEASED